MMFYDKYPNISKALIKYRRECISEEQAIDILKQVDEDDHVAIAIDCIDRMMIWYTTPHELVWMELHEALYDDDYELGTVTLSRVESFFDHFSQPLNPSTTSIKDITL